MKPSRPLILAALLAAGSLVCAQADPLRRDIEVAKGRIYPCLVNISVVAKSFSGGRTVRGVGAGSGTIISPAGHVLTNYHVARDAISVVCTLTTGEQIPADIVGDDAPTDLSVLKLRLAERTDPTRPLPFAILGDSDVVQVGDHVLAVGNPLSLSSSMTLGIVSNPRRVFSDFRGNEAQDLDFGAGNRTGMFTVWIQHDALILPGNSGGPLVNLQGDVIGINTRGGSGYGFATPANLAKRVVSQILTFGQVRRGWLGASFMPVGRMGRETGALVSDVSPTSPAEKAGMKPGDIVTVLAGRPVACRFIDEIPALYAELADLPAGREIEAVLLRAGQEINLRLVVAAMEEYVGRIVEYRDLGATLQEITAPMALARRYPDTAGVVLTGLRPGQAFEEAKPSILPGDVILSLDGKPVADLAAFDALLRAHKGDEIAVAYRRDREHLVTLVKLARDDKPKSGGELAKAWLGVKTQVVTPTVAKALGFEGGKGFRVTEVYPWTKAHEAGLREGDLLVAMDDTALNASKPQDAKDLQNRVEDLSVGDEVTFSVRRGAEELKIRVELEESPASAKDAKTAENKELEFKVRELTFMDRIERRLEKEQQGVLVTEATSGGWASLGGLSAGDLITAIDGAPTPDIKTMEEVLAGILAKQPRLISFFVRRGFRTTYVMVEPDWTKTEQDGKKAETGK